MQLTVALGAASVAFFAVMALFDVRADKTRTEIQRRRDRIEADRIRRERGSIAERVARLADLYGWNGTLTLPAAAFGLLYLAAAVALTIVGVDGIVGVVAAAGVAIAVVAGGSRGVRSRRTRRFNEQLVTALELFAAQLRGGVGPKRAIVSVSTSLPEPLRSEMLWVVTQTDGGRSLGDALADLSVRYPSKAMKLFVAAIRIDEQHGAQIAPAVEQAAAGVRRGFELAAEAHAELAQTRYEFYGIVSIVGFVIWLMIANADDGTADIYSSPAGIVWLTITGVNFAVGVGRVLRILDRARGEL